MIEYNSRDWRRLLFAFRGTVLARVLRRMSAYVVLTLGLWLFHTFAHGVPPSDPLAHSLLGVALGLLIVFRTNTSYDRYWEARKLWGTMVGATRNLIRGAVAYGGDAAGLVRLVTAYNRALKQHLRDSRDLTEIASLVPPEVYRHASAAADPPSILAYYLSRWIRDRLKKGELDAANARALENSVCSMVDSAGGCERIVQTPIPFAYAVHIKQMLFIYMISLPFVLVPKMDWIAVLAVAGVSFGLMGIEEAGVEIENPFGTDANDLPLEEFCTIIGVDGQALVDLLEPARRAA